MERRADRGPARMIRHKPGRDLPPLRHRPAVEPAPVGFPQRLGFLLFPARNEDRAETSTPVPANLVIFLDPGGIRWTSIS